MTRQSSGRNFVGVMLFATLCFVSAALLDAAVFPGTSAADSPSNTDWSLLGNSPEMQHHSDLSEISKETIAKLGLVWSVDLPAADGLVGNPLVQDGRIFQSGARSRIFANDLRTGKLLWTYEPMANAKADSYTEGYAMRTNRGVALHDDLVIVATGDCRLVAVDQKTGKLRWESPACESPGVEKITGAPRVGGGMVFIGNTGLDSGMNRGHFNAFDAKTGRHLWRFYTVPGDRSKPQDSPLYEMALATWGKGMTPGAGSVWEAITYDPELSQVYIGTSGPIPLDPTQRGEGAGDELFTGSIVALDAKTGEYRWHFKQSPGGGWNYEPMGIMVAMLPMGERGKERRVVLSVPKDGFVYVLDAETGEFISGRNYVRVNWAKGLDENTGRPIHDPAARFWEKPDGKAVVLPNSLGAHSFEALALDPQSHLLYIPAVTIPQLTETVTGDDSLVAELGMKVDLYYGSKGHRGWESFGELIAWDPVTQTAKWRQRHELPWNGGALHTDGGLVFQGGADGYFSAYDSGSGEKLWTAPAGGAIRGAPSTVMVDGRQFIIVPSGNGTTSASASSFTRYSSAPRARSKPRLLAYALGGTASAPPWAELPPIPKPTVARFDPDAAAHGQTTFEMNACSACHGMYGEALSGAAPDLRRKQPANVDYLKSVLGGALAAKGMPPFELSEADVEGLYAYLVNIAWDGYDAQENEAASAQ